MARQGNRRRALGVILCLITGQEPLRWRARSADAGIEHNLERDGLAADDHHIARGHLAYTDHAWTRRYAHGIGASGERGAKVALRVADEVGGRAVLSRANDH